MNIYDSIQDVLLTRASSVKIIQSKMLKYEDTITALTKRIHKIQWAKYLRENNENLNKRITTILKGKTSYINQHRLLHMNKNLLNNALVEFFAATSYNLKIIYRNVRATGQNKVSDTRVLKTKWKQGKIVHLNIIILKLF